MYVAAVAEERDDTDGSSGLRIGGPRFVAKWLAVCVGPPFQSRLDPAVSCPFVLIQRRHQFAVAGHSRLKHSGLALTLAMHV